MLVKFNLFNRKKTLKTYSIRKHDTLEHCPEKFRVVLLCPVHKKLYGAHRSHTCSYFNSKTFIKDFRDCLWSLFFFFIKAFRTFLEIECSDRTKVCSHGKVPQRLRTRSMINAHKDCILSIGSWVSRTFLTVWRADWFIQETHHGKKELRRKPFPGLEEQNPMW